MITDIGTKALASPRKIEVEHEEETEPRREVAEDGEKREPQTEEASTMKIEEVATLLKFLFVGCCDINLRGKGRKD